MYLVQSRYWTHLTNWLRVFPKDRLLLIVQEDIVADPVAQADRLYSFLGVDPRHRSALLFRRSHESVGARSPALFRAWRAVGDFGRRHGLGNLVDGVKTLPPVAVIMAANRRDLRAEVPSMHPKTERALQRELTSELMALADLVGRHDWPWPTWHAVKALTAERRSDVDCGRRRRALRVQAPRKLETEGCLTDPIHQSQVRDECDARPEFSLRRHAEVRHFHTL